MAFQVRPAEEDGKRKFHAGNPDDFALVSAAETIGIVMKSSEPIEGDRTRVVIGERQSDGSEVDFVYEILHRVSSPPQSRRRLAYCSLLI